MSTHLVASKIFAFKSAFLSALEGDAILTGFQGGRCSFSSSFVFLIGLVDLLQSIIKLIMTYKRLTQLVKLSY